MWSVDSSAIITATRLKPAETGGNTGLFSPANILDKRMVWISGE